MALSPDTLPVPDMRRAILPNQTNQMVLPRIWVSRRAALEKKIKADVSYLWQQERDKKNKRCILRLLLPSASWTLKERKERSLQPVLKSFYSRDLFLFSHSRWNQILFNLLGEAEKWIICALLWILENVWPLGLSPIYIPWPLVSCLLLGRFW